MKKFFAITVLALAIFGGITVMNATTGKPAAIACDRPGCQ